MKTFPFNPPINLVEERKWVLAVTSFEATKFVFTTAIENNSFSITILRHWNSKSTGKTIDELSQILELRSQNDFERHVEQVRKKG